MLVYVVVTSTLLVAYGLWLVRWLSTTPAAPLGWNLLISSTWAIASCLYIESGIYVLEQDRFSRANGAAAALLLASTVFFLATRATVNRLPPIARSQERSRGTDQQHVLLLAIAVIALTLLYANLALSPVPFFDHSIDQFDYWRYSRFPSLRVLLGNTSSIIAFILGLIYARRPGHSDPLRRVCIAAFVAYVLYLVLIGHKFSALFIAVLLWSIPTMMLRDRPLRIQLRTIVVLLGLAVIFGSLVFYRYNEAFNPFGTISAVDAIAYRILGLQGHLWWGVWQDRIADGVSPTLSLGQFMNGMGELMLRYGGPGTGDNPERGVTFTAGYPAIALHVLPLVAVPLAQLLTGAILGLASWYLYRLIRCDRVLEAGVMMQLALRYDYTVTMGAFGKVISLPVLALVLFFIIRECQIANTGQVHMATFQKGTQC